MEQLETDCYSVKELEVLKRQARILADTEFLKRSKHTSLFYRR